jgi:hypothetical protein
MRNVGIKENFAHQGEKPSRIMMENKRGVYKFYRVTSESNMLLPSRQNDRVNLFDVKKSEGPSI